MADEEEQTYTLTMEDGTTSKTSWGYSGKGNAVYSNGEIYDGDFVDGVSNKSKKLKLTFKRSELARESTLMPTAINTRENSKIIRSMVLEDSLITERENIMVIDMKESLKSNFLQVSLKMVKSTVKVCSPIPTRTFTLAGGDMAKNTVKAPMFSQILA